MPDNNLNLRSEKVRRLIGEIPPAITRWGITLLLVIFLLLLAALFLIPYPYGNGESILTHLTHLLPSLTLP